MSSRVVNEMMMMMKEEEEEECPQRADELTVHEETTTGDDTTGHGTSTSTSTATQSPPTKDDDDNNNNNNNNNGSNGNNDGHLNGTRTKRMMGDGALLLRSLPFDFVFTVDILPTQNRVRGRFVSTMARRQQRQQQQEEEEEEEEEEGQPLTTVLDGTSAAAVEHLCQQVYDGWLLKLSSAATAAAAAATTTTATSQYQKLKTIRTLPVVYQPRKTTSTTDTTTTKVMWDMILFPILHTDDYHHHHHRHASNSPDHSNHPANRMMAVGGLVTERHYVTEPEATAGIVVDTSAAGTGIRTDNTRRPSWMPTPSREGEQDKERKEYDNDDHHHADTTAEFPVTNNIILPRPPINAHEQTDLFQLLPIAFCMCELVTDPQTGMAIDYIFVDVNEHFEHMTGLSREITVDRPVTQVLPGIEHDAADWIGRTGRVIQHGWMDRFTSYSESLQRWYSGLTYRYDENRSVSLFVQNYLENISMEQAARESEEQHRTLFENMNQGVIYHDAKGRTTDANQAAMRISGHTMEQILGKDLTNSQWKFIRPDGSTIPVEQFPAVLALRGQTIHGMTFGVYNFTEQQVRWIKLDAIPRYRPGESKPYQAYTIFTDLTEEFKVEQTLLRAKEKAEEADQLKSAFLATMSHEIRTPLNGMMGHIDLILSNGLSKEYEKENLEGLHVAMESGQLLLSIIQDILDLSKIEAGQLDIDCDNLIPVRGMVENTMKLANAYRIQRKKDRIELFESVDESISDWILGDQLRLQQILNNLISNAIKFTDKGFVSLDIRKSPGQDLLSFRVHDTGKGIPEDRMGLVFEPFRQCDFGDTREHGGTGLGLTICRKLVELMGGTMSVESSTKHGSSGSRFSFTVPYHPADPSPGDSLFNQGGASQLLRNEVEDRRYASDSKLSQSPVSRTVLLAEDDEVSRKVAKRMMERLRFKVLEAKDGAEAVALFERHSDVIDCVVMDIMMPGVDGIEATQRIRLREMELSAGAKRVPIIALSAGAMKGDKERGLEAGMNDYLYKPISSQELETKLGAFFGVKKK